MARSLPSRRSVRMPLPPEESWIHGSRHNHARPGHRSEHGDLQHREFGARKSVTLFGPGADLQRSGRNTRAAQPVPKSPRHDSELLAMAKSGYGVLGHECPQTLGM